MKRNRMFYIHFMNCYYEHHCKHQTLNWEIAAHKIEILCPFLESPELFKCLFYFVDCYKVDSINTLYRQCCGKAKSIGSIAIFIVNGRWKILQRCNSCDSWGKCNFKQKKYNHIMIGILAEIFGSLLSELSLISIFNDTWIYLVLAILYRKHPHLTLTLTLCLTCVATIL